MFVCFCVCLFVFVFVCLFVFVFVYFCVCLRFLAQDLRIALSIIPAKLHTHSGSVWGQVACCCECGNEPSGAIKCGEFLD